MPNRALTTQVLILIAAMLDVGVWPARIAADGDVETFSTIDSPGDTENICQSADGVIFVTGMVDRVVWRINSHGTVEKFATVPEVAMVIGVAPFKEGVVITASERSWRRPGQTPATDFSDVGPEVLVIDKAGKVVARVRGGKGQFFNGITQAGGGKYLIADTQVATVWEFDSATRQLTAWLQDDLLAGANGIKAHNKWVYIGTRNGLQRIEMDHGRPKGKLMLFAKDARPDDFGVAKDGSIFYPSGRTLFKVSPVGEVTKFREDIQGGAAAWVSNDNKWVYWPTRGGVGPQKVLRTPISIR